MSLNLYGTNSMNCNVTLNYVSCYIVETEKAYRNDVFHGVQYPDEDEYSFVGFFHTFSGKGIIKTVSNTLHVETDSIVFVRYKDVLSISSCGDNWNFYCQWFFLNNLTLDYEKVFHLAPLAHERETFERIIRYLNCNDFYYLCRANGLGLTLLGELLSHIETNSLETSPNQKLIRKTLFYINQHIAEDLSINELAKQCNLSEKHFRFLFIKYTGMSPKQYIIKAKFNKATFLLINTTWNITEISDSLSFLSPAYFISRFKKYYKMTPSQWRIQNLIPEQTNPFFPNNE